MADQSIQHYVGLDIGTSKVRCIVGVVNSGDGGEVSIVGYGSAATNGMRNGVVVYADDVAESIISAVNEAERISGIRINAATINVNGGHVVGINSKGVVAISAANRQINEDDRARVEDAATIVQLPPNREIVQLFAKNYRLDGQGNIKDPIGMQGVRLEVDSHIVTAATPSLRNLEAALDKAQISINRRTISSLAAAEAVLSRQQKEAGTAVIDIGAGTTNLVVIEDGEVQHAAIIPMGGLNITNDLAIGLKTDIDVAEQVKIQHARIDDKSHKENISVELDQNIHNFKFSDVKMITEARVEEVLD
ncbi:MAG: cell division protein FtsA, partial [Candidatus Saccharimonadales bacterium]